MIGGLAALPAAGLAVLYLAPSLQASRALLGMAASFIPFAIPLWLVSLMAVIGCGRGRGRWWAVPVGVGLVAQICWALPYLPHRPPEPNGEPLRLLALNLQYGRGDPGQVAAVVAREQPDVLVFTEVTDAFLNRAREGLAGYPYRAGSSDPNGTSAAGTIVLSRTPVTELEHLTTTFGNHVVRVSRPNGSVVLVAAHPVNPLSGAAAWAQEPQLIRDAVLRHQGQPVVVAGDLNATLEHLTVRRLLRAGLTDAADQAGAGWLPTFSTETGPVPPVIAIDHVLVNSRVTATTVTAFEVEGSDHRGLVVTLTVR